MAELKTGESVGVDPGFGRWPEVAPSWATVFGEDDRGIFAHCEVRGVPFAWRWIPSGRFRMGSPKDEPGRDDDEGPQHDVHITRGFWLGEIPVAQCQWEAVMGSDSKPSFFKGRWHPVEQVTWDECMAMAKALSDLVPGLDATLPTEAQWEYACRAGSTGAFHDGSPCTVPVGLDPALDKLGWFDGNSGSREQVVGQKRCNARGLYDMHGNVQEWCRDAMRVYSDAAQWNPTGADPALLAQLGKCVLRGGSSSASAYRCRSSSREEVSCGLFGNWQGFRLVATHPFGAA